MSFDLVEEAKQHPVPAALIAGGVVLGFLLITGAFSGGRAPTQTGGLDPATASLYAQTEQLQASKQAQIAQINGQQVLATTQANYGLALAQIQANAQTTATNTAASVALARIQADSQTSQESIAAQLQAMQGSFGVQSEAINAQLAGLMSNNATTMHIADTTAQEQEIIAGINGNTTIALSNNVTAVQQGQTQASVMIANSNNSVAKQKSSDSMWGSIAGAALNLLAFI
jgi:hypothetical protein